MTQNLLQDNLYGDLLSPTFGYHTDFAVGMTYSLDFDTLLTAGLAFGMLNDVDNDVILSPHILFESILKNSDKMVIFCNKGCIAVPPTIRKVYSLLEKNVFEVFNPEDKTANFHPKMWLIREVGDDNSKDILLKLIITSRNMAYADTIDCIAAMSGKVGSAIVKNRKHSVLRYFIERVVTYSNINDEQKINVLKLAKELERVEHFDVDSPDNLFEDYDFYPYLFNEDFGLGNVEDYLRGTESIIVSPFIDKKLLRRICLERKEHRALITRMEYVDREVFDMFDSKGGVYITHNELANEKMDLHAKMYLVWNGRDDNYLFLGSANATTTAFERNGELLLCLKFKYGNSKFDYFLKNFYEEGNKDSKFIRMNSVNEKNLQYFKWSDSELALKEFMCADDLSAKITHHRNGLFSIAVTSSQKKLKHPVSIAPLQKKDQLQEWNGRVVFEGLTTEELSEFYIVSSSDDERNVERIIKIVTDGMPENRDACICKSVIKNKRDFVKFLELMLTDTPIQYLSNGFDTRKIGTRSVEVEPSLFPQLYEKMLRAAASNPKMLLQIGKIIDKLDEDTIPEGFDTIYQQFANAIK